MLTPGQGLLTGHTPVQLAFTGWELLALLKDSTCAKHGGTKLEAALSLPLVCTILSGLMVGAPMTIVLVWVSGYLSVIIGKD